MFTRKRWQPPLLSADPRLAVEELKRSIAKYLIDLERPDSLVINESEITASNGIKFPATQSASSDVNTLDDYEEASTTPTPTASSGTFTTVAAAVKATKTGDRVSFTATVTITTNGTAAGVVLVPLPYTPAENSGCGGAEVAATGAGLAAIAQTDGNLYIRSYDGTYPGADGRTLTVTGSYRV